MTSGGDYSGELRPGKRPGDGFDPFDGLEEQAGDDCLDAHAGAIFGSLDDEALVLIVTRILPLGHDLDAVTDIERFGGIASNRLSHDRR
jgi:hypothetical protein